MLGLCSSLLTLATGCAPPTALDTVAHDSVEVTAQEQARAADSLVNSIGVNVHLSYFQTTYGSGWSNIVKPKLIALGVRHLRDGGNVTPDDSWMRTVYGRMAELTGSGIKFDLVMMPALNSSDYAHVPQFQRLLQFAAPVIESFEGLNEHDVSGRSQWSNEVRAFQQDLYSRVKADPLTSALPVYGPSMAHPKNATAVGALTQWMDFGSIHPYPGGALPGNSVKDHEERTATISGSHGFVATETGYHTAIHWTGDHPGVSEQAQARYTTRLLLDYFNAGVNRTYLYEFLDQGNNLSNRELSFGLLRADGTEKPAYGALRNLITILRDPGPSFTPGVLDYSLSGDSVAVKHTLLQKRDGRFYLILWQNAKSFDLQARSNITVDQRPTTLVLASPASQLRVFTPLTSAAAVDQARGAARISVQVSDTPVIIEVTP